MAEKLLDGGSLFDDVSERMRWGIRSRFPGADEVQDILLRQIDRLRRVEGSRVYQPVEDGDDYEPSQTVNATTAVYPGGAMIGS